MTRKVAVLMDFLLSDNEYYVKQRDERSPFSPSARENPIRKFCNAWAKWSAFQWYSCAK